MALPAWAVQPASRIATVDSSVTVALPGTVNPLAKAADDNGTVADSMQLSGLALHFQRSATQQAALETLIEQQGDPSSPKFHQWLTQETFAAQFGMSAADIAKARAWLEAQGFTVLKVADSGNAIYFTGTAGQVRRAMNTQIRHYNVDGEMHYSNAGDVMLPAALAGVVGHVSGLNDFKPTPKSRRALADPSISNSGLSPQFTSGITGSHYLAPGDFSTIYNVAPLYSAGYTGAGQTIGIAGQTDIELSDIAAFRAAAGLTAKAPMVVLTTGSSDPGTSYTDLGEASLDLEWSGGVAPGANIVYLNSTNAFYSLIWGIQNRVSLNSISTLIPILSASYGLCEAKQSTSTLSTMEAAFQQAAAQGQTVIAASGDTGAADCDSSTATISTNGLAVDYPASSAYVTGVGGTEFNDQLGNGVVSTGATTYWNGNVTGTSAGDILSSAKSYIPEVVWNDRIVNSTRVTALTGGGGGASILYSKPSWQTGVAGIPADGKRDVPDIALNASNFNDSYLVCTQVVLKSTNQYAGSCGNGFRIADGSYSDTNNLTAYGGTSVGAPSFAGVVALISQKTGAPVGPVNKTLYALASNATTYASAFHDVTAGSNQMPCSTGTGCSGGLVGYTATTGYDLATGLGSIDAANLATAYSSYYFAHGGIALSLTYTPTPVVAGVSTTFTASVTYSGSTTPTGTVTFTIDGTAVTALPLASGAASTTYTFARGGTHTVTAVYSGDTNYASISRSATLTLGNPAFTIAVPAMTVSSAVNATASTATATITSSGDLNDPITLDLTSTNYPGCGYVTPTVVTPPANGSVTAVITLGNCTNASLLPYGRKQRDAVVAAGIGTGQTWFAGGMAGVLGLLLIAGLSRKRRLPRMMAVFAVVLLGGLLAGTVGCSGNGVTVSSNGLTPGIYQVTITGTDWGNTDIAPVSTTFTVTVK